MKLVAATKVRRAQEAVINARTFAETPAEFLCPLNEQLQVEDLDVRLTNARPVRKVALIVVTGDQGPLWPIQRCSSQEGGDPDRRTGKSWIGPHGDSRQIKGQFIFYADAQCFPAAKEAQVVADEVFSLFIRVELAYTKFVSIDQV
ncbi:hypothetical protein NL676_024339 [Syzygium grande]|nr:hypothetical protein NL676_024339 [Syzygium grande]